MLFISSPHAEVILISQGGHFKHICVEVSCKTKHMLKHKYGSGWQQNKQRGSPSCRRHRMNSERIQISWTSHLEACMHSFNFYHHFFSLCFSSFKLFTLLAKKKRHRWYWEREPRVLELPRHSILLIYFEQQFICNVREGVVLTHNVTATEE